MDVYGLEWTEMDSNGPKMIGHVVHFCPFRSIPVHKRPFRPCPLATALLALRAPVVLVGAANLELRAI